MTPQEIFDKAVNGVIEQGNLCKNGDSCRYRLHGMKCAVGHLIPDENYAANIEGENPKDSALVQDAIPADVSAAVSWEWLTELQATHDNAETIADFKSYAANFAKNNGLKFGAEE